VKLYKLTDQDDRTYNNTQWGEGVKHMASGKGELCTDGWIHAYTDPLLAVLLNPIHANIQNAHLWEAEGEIGMDDHGLKVGCASLTTIRRIDVPVVTTEQRVRFSILCTRTVYTETTWTMWADAWLSGVDRSAAAAWVAGAAAWAAEAAGAATGAAGAAAEAAEATAEAAAWAAEAEAWTAGAARAARAAAMAAAALEAEAWTARAARAAAMAAAEWAAATAEKTTWAADAAPMANLNLPELAREAITGR